MKKLLLILIFLTSITFAEVFVSPAIGISTVYGPNASLDLFLEDAPIGFQIKGGSSASSVGLNIGACDDGYCLLAFGGTISYIRSYNCQAYYWDKYGFEPRKDGLGVTAYGIVGPFQMDFGIAHYPKAEVKTHMSLGFGINFSLNTM
jgi:hypothetical protein